MAKAQSRVESMFGTGLQGPDTVVTINAIFSYGMNPNIWSARLDVYQPSSSQASSPALTSTGSRPHKADISAKSGGFTAEFAAGG